MADSVEDFQRLKQEFVGLRARLLTLTGTSPSALEPPTARHYETLNPDVQRVLMDQMRSANEGMRARLTTLGEDGAELGEETASGDEGSSMIGIGVLIAVAVLATLLLALLS